jgi:hypothetical protein
MNDAAAPPAVRWNASAAGDASNAVKLAWNQEAPSPGDMSLNFSEYVGNFFQTKPGLDCGNMADNPCDDTITCDDDITPAGYAPSIPKPEHSEADDKTIRRYLIVNSMVALHLVCSHLRCTILKALAYIILL